nr:dTDP-4-dehydrorhamnose reductase [uncultured Desulfuromonas sp.]
MGTLRIALIGANGMLASMFRRTTPPTVQLYPFDLPQFDLTDHDQVRSLLFDLAPEIIINCAAFTQVDNCETQQSLAYAVNGAGPGVLAEVAREIQATLVHISTDFVFSGEKTTPYTEDDPTGPISVYGKSKLQGEQTIRESGLSQYYIVRTSWLYGPEGPNFVETMIRLAGEREVLGIVADQLGSPTSTYDLADAVWRLLALTDGARPRAEYGIYHYSNEGVCSWYDFTCEIVSQLHQFDQKLVVKTINPIATTDYPVPAGRPAYSVLSKEKITQQIGLKVPAWQVSLHHYLQERFNA